MSFAELSGASALLSSARLLEEGFVRGWGWAYLMRPACILEHFSIRRPDSDLLRFRSSVAAALAFAVGEALALATGTASVASAVVRTTAAAAAAAAAAALTVLAEAVPVVAIATADLGSTSCGRKGEPLTSEREEIRGELLVASVAGAVGKTPV